MRSQALSTTFEDQEQEPLLNRMSKIFICHCVQAIDVSHAEGFGTPACTGCAGLRGRTDFSGQADGPPPRRAFLCQGMRQCQMLYTMLSRQLLSHIAMQMSANLLVSGLLCTFCSQSILNL